MHPRARRREFLICFLLVCACGVSLHRFALEAEAQRRYASVTVRVSDALTEEPLTMADVQLQTLGHGDFTQRGFTDSTGSISFSAVERGNYNLLVQEPGYFPARQAIDVHAGATENFFISLARQPDSHPGYSDAGRLAATTLAVPAGARKEFIAGASRLKDDPANSAKRFLKAIEKYPGYAEAYAMLGLAYMRQKQVGEALKALDRAIELDPRLSLARTLRGKLYREGRRFSEAEKELLESIRMDGQAWDAHYELAFCYYYRGDTARAVDHARRAHDLPQASPLTHLLLVDLHMRLNNSPAALQELVEFARAEPQSPLTPRVQKMIQELRGAGTASLR